MMGSGEPGSSSNSAGKRTWAGVRHRGLTVELKGWYEDMNFYKDVKMPEVAAALVHDFARLYSDPGYAEEGLNIHKVVAYIQRELDPELASLMPLNMGKTWLDEHVSKCPLKHATEEWLSLEKKQKDELKDEIVARAPTFVKVLEEKIACEHSRAGRQKKDLDEIPPLLQENDVQELNKENQDLKGTISARNVALEAKDAEILSLKEEKDAEIVFWKEECDAAHKARDAAHKGRDIVMEELYAAKQAARAAGVTPFKAGVAGREESLQTKEIQELKAIIRAKYTESESKDAEIASLKEAMESAIEAKEMAWYIGIQLASRIPCNRSSRSVLDLDAVPQDDDWMDTTELDNHPQSATN